ncbi:MAG: family 16 glycosylhydrolase [Bacteroidia bacterium]
MRLFSLFVWQCIFVLALLPYCAFSQGAEDICWYVPANCNNCAGTKISGIQCGWPYTVCVDDCRNIQVVYDNTAGSAVNPISKTGYRMVFGDEFPQNQPLDTLRTHSSPVLYYLNKRGNTYPKWLCTDDTSSVRGSGGGGSCNDAAFDNIFILPDDGSDGKLVLKTLRMPSGGGCSERFSVNGLGMNGRIRYGFLEARIKVPRGVGLWPSFVWWSPGWQYQEIDIFEFFQHGGTFEPGNFCGNTTGHDVAFGTTWKLHSGIYYDPDGDPYLNQTSKATYIKKGTTLFPFNGSCGSVSGYKRQLDMADDFFTYAVEWTPDSVFFFLNNVMYWKASHKMNEQPMQIGFAVNVNKPGDGLPNANTPSINQMEIDYVRVYKKDTQTEFNRILDGFPSQICNVNPFYGVFSPMDHIPNATYNFSVLSGTVNSPLTGTSTATIVPNLTFTIRDAPPPGSTTWVANGVTYKPYYGMDVDFVIPSSLAAGNYTLRLTLSLPDGTVRHCYKPFKIIKAVSPQPGIISITQNGGDCDLSISPVSNALSYIWTVNGNVKPYKSTYAYLLGSTSLQSVSVKAENACGVSVARTQSMSCEPVCAGCPQRVNISDSTQLPPSRGEVINQTREKFVANHEGVIEISIQPNPVSEDEVIVRLPDHLEDVSLQLFDSEGQLVRNMERVATTTLLDIRNLPSGLYFVVIKSKTHYYTEKLVRE